MSDSIVLRFVLTHDVAGWAISTREDTCMPFTPSHVEAVIEGKYVGQHLKGGMLARDPGYDKAVLKNELFVTLPCTGDRAGAADSFNKYMMDSLGQPYDWEAILDYALLGNWHIPNHAICSAKAFLGLRAKPVPYFYWPVTTPAHLINPRDLLLILSTHVKIDH